MKSSLSIEQLNNLQKILQEQSEEWLHFGKSLNLELGCEKPKVCAMIMNPKQLDEKYEKDWAVYQKEYSNYLCKVMSNFEVAREFLEEYSSGDELINLLLKLDSEISLFRKEKVYPQYPEMEEICATFLRNDFLFDKNSKKMLQTEINLVCVACMHYHQHAIKFLKKLYFKLDLRKDFESKEDNFYMSGGDKVS